jgi:XTP/dITP diphosphohydrolase
MQLLLATRNQGKIRELHDLLSGIGGVEILTFHDRPFDAVEETGTTFRENALLKARTIAAQTDLAVLADDAGLEVDALDGAPGVYSARFSGVPVDPARNNALLLERLARVEDRRARFRICAVLRLPDGREYEREGTLPGRITHAPRGTQGFGYDPLFVPDGSAKTLAEMSLAEKNAISHRRRAIAAIREVIEELVRSQESRV